MGTEPDQLHHQRMQTHLMELTDCMNPNRQFQNPRVTIELIHPRHTIPRVHVESSPLLLLTQMRSTPAGNLCTLRPKMLTALTGKSLQLIMMMENLCPNRSPTRNLTFLLNLSMCRVGASLGNNGRLTGNY